MNLISVSSLVNCLEVFENKIHKHSLNHIMICKGQTFDLPIFIDTTKKKVEPLLNLGFFYIFSLSV